MSPRGLPGPRSGHRADGLQVASTAHPPRRRGLAHAGRRAAGAWRQVVPSTRPEEGPRLPGLLAVAWAPAVGRGRGQSCGMRTLSARPCPGEGHVCPASQHAFSPTRRPRGFPLERLQCLGRHRGGNRVRISPALQGKPGRQPRGPLSWALSAWWSPPRGAGAEWACVWRQAAVRSALRGVQVQVRPPPGRVHSAGSAPASPTGLGISPRSPCPAGRLRGRRLVGRVRPAVRGTGFWGDQMAWRLSVDGEPSCLCRIRPCHAGDVWPQAPWSRLYGGDSGPCLTRLSRSPGCACGSAGRMAGREHSALRSRVASGTSFADPAQSSSRGLFFVSCVLRWHPCNSKIFPRLHSQPSGSWGSLPPTE